VWVCKKFFVWLGFLGVCVLGFVLVSSGVSGSVWAWFSALSMLSKSTFDVAESDVYPDAALLWLENEFQRKKGTNPFSLLLLDVPL